MASFPSAVKSFVTRNIGDVIQPADVNDLQDEVTAIEAGYINGTAPLNAAASTLASLSVTGNSTIAGTLTVGQLVISGAPYCTLRNDGTQAIPDSVWTGLNFNTEDDDVGSMHSTAVNSSRVLITSTGLYQIMASATFALNSSGTLRSIRFFKNDTSLIPGCVLVPPSAAIALGLALSIQHRFTSSNDYVTAQVIQNTGSNLNVGDSTATHLQSMFAVHKVIGV